MSIKNLLKKSGDAMYLGGAGASLAAAVPVAVKYKEAFLGLPWQELTSAVKYPWEVIGVGQLGLVLRDYSRDAAEGIEPNWLEHAGRFMRPANLAAIPVAYATDDSGVSLALTGGATVIGYILEGAGRYFRKIMDENREMDGMDKTRTLDELD